MTKTISDVDVRALTDPDSDPVDREAALRHLAHWEKGKYIHLESTIANLFHDPIPMVRGASRLLSGQTTTRQPRKLPMSKFSVFSTNR
jgi:hypothetical protein